MARRLVHLNAVRAFEAAARHLSFAKAAAELAVTPAAVSQQIKTLEEHLGTPLFRRTKRALFLTDAAQAMLPDVREGFDRIAGALARGRRGHARTQLVVSVTPSIAAKWLVPRLHRFAASHPDVDVRLHTTTRLVDFGREDVDLNPDVEAWLVPINPPPAAPLPWATRVKYARTATSAPLRRRHA